MATSDEHDEKSVPSLSHAAGPSAPTKGAGHYFSGDCSHRRLLLDAGIVVCFSIAASLYFFRNVPRGRGEVVVTDVSVPELSYNPEKPSRNKRDQELDEGLEAEAVLRSITKTVKYGKDDDLQWAIGQCLQLRSRKTDPAVIARAFWLESLAFEALGHPKDADDAYRGFVTALGVYVVKNAENRGKSPDEAKAEANRAEAVEWLRRGKALFERQDYSRMLAYLDILLTRYHDSEEAQWAALLNGKSLVAIGRHAEAVDRYHALLETHPDGPAAFEAALLLPQALWLSGQHDGAAQAWLDFVDRVGADEWRAYGYFNAGKYFSWLGTLPSQAKAMDCFRKAKALYGTSPQATNVEREFTRLRRRGLADILPE